MAQQQDWTAWTPQLRNLEKMLRYRDYQDVSQVMHGDDPLLVCTARAPLGEQVFVYFLTENKVGVKTLRRLREECQAAECHHAILVTQDGLTPFAAKELDETSRGGDVVEVFRRKELSFCVVEHELVPPHTLLDAAEKKALLQRRGFKASVFPRIKASDPVARFMNFPIGGIVKIRRSIGSSDGETYYRLVVA
jgi:DNA-directed RNA polymerase I, II, and III subunit RPABC1